MGLSLAGPQALGVAAAEDSAASSAADSADSSAAQGPVAKRPTAARAARSADISSRTGADRPVAPSAAATGVTTSERVSPAASGSAVAAGNPVLKPGHARRGARALPSAPVSTRPATRVAADDDIAHSTAPVAAPVAAPDSPPEISSAGPIVSNQPAAAAPATVPPGSALTTASPPSPAPARPAALLVTGDRIGTAAASTGANALGDVLTPIQAFVEGILLLVRRTFFNQAPTAFPVQLTGQSAGPITGTIGAVDPEGDPIVYRLTQGPRYGTALVAADGTYTYTPGADFNGADTFTVAATDTGFHINLLDLFRPASTLAGVAVTQGTLGALLSFQFIYGSGSQHWSPAARSALESTATFLSSYFVVSAPVTLTYNVTGEFSPLSSTLASAGSALISTDPGFLQTVVQNKIQSGVDSNGSAADGDITWNFGRSWGYGAVEGGQYDFESTAMHELLHTFGFLTYVDRAGSNTGRSWTAYDGFMVTSGGTSIFLSDFTWNPAYDTNLTGGNGGLYFDGANAVAAYGGLIPLYTPGTWAAGSSLSHLDDRRFTGTNKILMTAVSGTGRGVRVLSPVELGILSDIGYTVVPGPGGSVLLFFVVFARLRRRRD